MTVKQGPDENKSKGIVLTRVQQLGKATRDELGRGAAAVDGVDAKCCEEGGGEKEGKSEPVFEAEDASDSARKAG